MAGGQGDDRERENVPTALLVPAVSGCERRQGRPLTQQETPSTQERSHDRSTLRPRRGPPTSPRGARRVTERKRPHHKSHCRMQDDPQHHQP